MVDLFKLLDSEANRWIYCRLKEKWGFVAKECELGFGVIPSIKLIYFKHLNQLDQWLWQISNDRAIEDGQSRVLQKLDLLSRKLEIKLRDSS